MNQSNEKKNKNLFINSLNLLLLNSFVQVTITFEYKLYIEHI